MKIFVSNASEFLAKAVVSELAKKGHEVIGHVRDEQGASIVKNAGGRAVVGDLCDNGGWCKEVHNADRVIIMTQPFSIERGLPKDLPDEIMEEYGRRYTESVTNIIKAASDGKAKSVVVTHCSTCLGDRKGKWASDADNVDPIGFCRPLTGHFETIARVAEDAELPLVQVYAGYVYGSGGWFPQLVEGLRGGMARIVGSGDNYWSLIHVEDAAAYIALAAEKLDRNESFCLADDRPVTQSKLLNYIADLLDAPSPKNIDFEEFKKEFGLMMAEVMVNSTRIQGIKAMDLLGHIPVHRSYEEGIAYTLKSMGIEPRKELEKAA